MRIAIAAHLDDAAIALCRAELSADDVEWVVGGKAGAPWRDSLADCEVVFGTVPTSWIAQLTSLRWLQLESIGFEYYGGIVDEIADRGIEVTNLRGQFAHPAAETALAGILGLLRGVDQLVLANVERRWASLAVRPTTDLLHGKEVVVLGSGSIGSQVRRLLEAFDCRVRSFARTSSDAELHTADDLDDALGTADLVVNCLPETSETRGLISRERLALLAPTSLFVNVGRGSVVDEDALAQALLAGNLGGAVLDVTAEEPLAAGNPLWTTPRTILTQHTGGGYRDELLDKARRFLANLALWRSGQALKDRVNWEAGY